MLVPGIFDGLKGQAVYAPGQIDTYNIGAQARAGRNDGHAGIAR
jgi:hypothetical protein